LAPIIGVGFFGIEHFTPPWDIFYLPLFNLLIAAYQILFNDFALAIIVFTVVIRTLLAPLFVKQIRSQKEMQQMQPLVREIQRKHKGNRQKVAEETMALYKEHGVNQFGGCLPVLVQLPILFALYQALIRASNVVTVTAQNAASETFAQLQAALPGIRFLQEQGENMLYRAPVSGTGPECNLPQFSGGDFTHFLPLNCQLIDPLKLSEEIQTTVPWLLGLDLAQPDRTFALVIGGFGISAIALIAAVLQFVQVKMTSPRPNPDDPTAATTSTMIYLFPLLTIFWGGLFPSGLILYWAVYTGYLLGHQFLIMGWGNLFPLFGWQPHWAPPPDQLAPPKRRTEAQGENDAKSNDAKSNEEGAPDRRAQSTTQRQTSAPGTNRPLPRPQTKRRRRGRKR
jgi:YidC/Oxa1 family membrane protein insertase